MHQKTLGQMLMIIFFVISFDHQPYVHWAVESEVDSTIAQAKVAEVVCKLLSCTAS